MEIETFYDKEGKQNAVLVFLSLVLKNKKPQTLLLYSEEDMDWLTDPIFLPKWSNLMLQIIRQGCRIKIIHNTNRNFDQMISGIKEWIPLYMTGAIEPYYYPKTRDGLFNQTFFIAPQTAAITSSSVNAKTKNTSTFLYTNKKTIDSLMEEYQDFVILCRPLMRVFTPHREEEEEYLTIMEEFQNETSNTIIKTNTLSDITIPLELAESFLERMPNAKKEKLLACHLEKLKKYTDNLAEYSVIEIFTLPSLELILAGKVEVNFSNIFNDTLLFYTPAEYVKHLKNLLKLLDLYDNYHIILLNKQNIKDSMIYVKEDVGVIISKSLPHSIVFAINESNMVAAFWGYMNNILNKNPLTKESRIQTINELEKLIFSIEKALIKGDY